MLIILPKKKTTITKGVGTCDSACVKSEFDDFLLSKKKMDQRISNKL